MRDISKIKKEISDMEFELDRINEDIRDYKQREKDIEAKYNIKIRESTSRIKEDFQARMNVLSLAKEGIDNEEYNKDERKLKKKYAKGLIELEDIDEELKKIEKSLSSKYSLRDIERDYENKEYTIDEMKEVYKKVKSHEYRELNLDTGKEIIDLLLTPKGNYRIVYILYSCVLLFGFMNYINLVLLCLVGIGVLIFIFLLNENRRILNDYFSIKALRDNIEILKPDLQEDFSRVLQDSKNDFEDTKLNRSKKLEEELDVVKSEEYLTKELISDTERDINNEKRIELKEIEEYLRSLKDRREILINKLDKLQRELEDTEAEIGESIMNYKLKDKNYILPKEIIFNVNPRVSLQLKREENVFKYDNEEDLSKFLEFLILQILMNINPFCIRFTIIDMNSMGKSVLSLLINRDIIEVLHEQSKVEALERRILERYDENLKEMRGYTSIDDYNEKMLSIESLTKEYQVMIYIDPEKNKLESINMTKLVNTASLSGVIPIIMIGPDSDIRIKGMENIGKYIM